MYTVLEINTTVLAYRKRLSTKAMLDYKLADLIGLSVNRLLDKNAKMPTPQEAYSGLIEPERPKTKKQLELERKRATAKATAWLYQYAEANNKKHREE